MLNNNNMDMPMASVHDTSGRCSPIGGSNDSKVSFGFTQEQVECVCEVKTHGFNRPHTFVFDCMKKNFYFDFT